MPKKNLTFEQALVRLETIVRDMESGDLSLEVSMKHYESGIELAAFCQKALEDARLKISELSPVEEKVPSEDEDEDLFLF